MYPLLRRGAARRSRSRHRRFVRRRSRFNGARRADPAADFATLLDRFYAAATQALLRRDAVIDKLIGDEVMAFFVRSISGPDYTKPSVRGWSC